MKNSLYFWHNLVSQEEKMNHASNLIFSRLPICINGYRHLIVINEDQGLLTLASSDTNGGKYYIAIPENHLIFQMLEQNNTLVIHKRELFEKYAIAFVDFRTISKPQINA